MSEVYFRRIFHTLYGKSPKEYMIAMRIERARQLLSDGGFSVREVAALCGYFEETHFSREFKRHVGCAPSEFIK
jgi:AraC-like DNA-binding protein